MSDNHVELLQEWNIPVWSHGFWGSRFSGIVGGVLQDMLAEAAATALASTWLYDFSPRPYDISFDQPLDALITLGAEAGLPWYPGESHYESLKPRLRAKWSFWTGSPKAGMIAELATAGFGAVAVVVPNDYAVLPDSHSDHWSRFWIDIPTNPLTGPGITWGMPTVFGGTLLLGPAGGTPEYFGLLASIVRRLKPVQWIPWEYRFDVAGGIIALQGTVRPTDPDYVYWTP